MTMILHIVHGLLMFATFAAAADFYHDFGVSLPPEVNYILFAAIVGVSLVLALGHVVGGGLMGFTAGGVLSGMKLGLLLGSGMAVGRLWPYLGLIAAAAFVFDGPLSHVISFGVACVVCLGVNMVLKYIWSHVS
jgi:hypothetical protein